MNWLSGPIYGIKQTEIMDDMELSGASADYVMAFAELSKRLAEITVVVDTLKLYYSGFASWELVARKGDEAIDFSLMAEIITLKLRYPRYKYIALPTNGKKWRLKLSQAAILRRFPTPRDF